MSKVYVLNTILKSVLWLCLCCAAPAVMAENSPLKEEAPCGVTISGPSVKDACPDQEVNLRGGPYQISFTAAGSGGGPYSYSWTVVNGGGTGATNADLSNANTATVTIDTKDLGYGTITLRCTVTGTCSGSSPASPGSPSPGSRPRRRRRSGRTRGRETSGSCGTPSSVA